MAKFKHITKTRCGTCKHLHVDKRRGGYNCPKNLGLIMVAEGFAEKCGMYEPKVVEAKQKQ